MKGIVSCCVLVTILVIAADVHAYRKFGRDCRDIACAPGERCIISRVPCNAPDELEENQCGQYPVCEEVEQKQMSADQKTNAFTIDTTQTIANTRSSITTLTSTIKSTNRTQPNRSKIIPDRDNDFELLNDYENIDSSSTLERQRQANVLVIVQDGPQQSQLPNRGLGQYPPCTISPYYPYNCNYPLRSNVPGSLSTGIGLPPYPQTRAANVPQLVPPTPPCYYNCYPRGTQSPYGQYGYPLARSTRPVTSTNNYLFYLSLAG
ncbi:uncharacterized protein LOC108153783 isoform X2 [Drosophila miranda]|uniref:uncharacterized protein LOC108153783 isoform X2 n=1 Tax=Drosophila miranda TaxID=7229 RepID=UPI0007E5CED6|nr:uncharacterized protein LOC108153783 isoform X2 [Drosophila miranda]